MLVQHGVLLLFAFLCGSLPFAAWIGRLCLGVNLRHVGDGNPGSFNVYLAGGARWALLALMLDVMKGAIPVGLAYRQVGSGGAALAAIALAPVLGHAFSPWLRFRGGKALAVTFGIWSGLTLWEAPLVLGLSFTSWVSLLASDGLAVIFGMFSLLAYLLVTQAPPSMLWVCIGNLVILAWRHRDELWRPPPVPAAE
jgi:glycerol-3-phosphate acyltransferase PlsY